MRDEYREILAKDSIDEEQEQTFKTDDNDDKDDEDKDDEDDDELIEVRQDEEEDDESDESDDEESTEESRQREKYTLKTSAVVRHGYMFLLHLFCIAIYLLPMLMPSEYNQGHAVLDELHITQDTNKDINGETTIRTIFSNDYWGRPMTSASSHKSWRPLTVLTFRHFKGIPAMHMNTLTAYRLFNVLTHAATAEAVGILSTKLLVTHADPLLLRVLTKLLWALHPTHVEVTANAANRPHLLAVLCSVIMADPDTPWAVFLVALLAGFLSAETFLFQIVPVAATLFAIQYIRLYHTVDPQPQQRRRRRQRSSSSGGGGGDGLMRQVLTAAWQVAARIVLVVTGGLAYAGGRYYFDTLSIPDGLIRPAENPFYSLTGQARVRNYAYVLAIHAAKAWDLDFVGFSHEYGHACIKTIDSWEDERLYIPAAMVLVTCLTAFYLAFIRQRRRASLSIGLLLFLVHLAWMATLFPVAGIVKVGTFIADRIVVTSTVSVSIIMANAVTSWVLWRPKDRKQHRQKLWILALVGLCMWRRVHNRTLEWMDSIPLLKSSLETCPDFAKGHLEISKVYSGLYPERYDLNQSKWHLQQVEAIDPDFCDVHAQFAHVAIQEHRYTEFEERLTKAMMCQFTLGSSMNLWQRYWSMAQDLSKNPPEVVAAAKKRYEKHLELIQIHVQKEEAKEQRKQSSSPLVGWDRDQEL